MGEGNRWSELEGEGVCEEYGSWKLNVLNGQVGIGLSIQSRVGTLQSLYITFLKKRTAPI